MKLSNYIRDAFITAAMQDVPKKADHTEAIRKLAHDDILSRELKQVQELWADPNLRDYVNDTTIHVADLVSIAVPRKEWRYQPKLSDKVKAKVEKLAEEMKADEKMRNDLRIKLRGAAYACTSTKQLRELLPEFGKYLPAEEEKTYRTLPVVANIVAEFTKAGWPAKKEGATA